jgi:hypothetical protein
MPRLLPVSRWPLLIAVTAILAVAGFMSRPAQAQDLPPIYLGNNPMVLEDRIQLLREEARERQREIKEARERAKEARELAKHPHKAKGRHAEPRLGDEDVTPASLDAMREALQYPPQGTLSAPLNTRANNKLGDSLGSYTAGEAEQSIVFLGQNGICAWNDGRGFYKTPQDVQAYGYTTNGGATWTDGGVMLKQGTISTWSSDPVVTVNEKTGYFYYCGLTTNTGSMNGVGVTRGHFSGSSFVWDAATMVSSGLSSSNGYDKQWMCADSLNGNLYVTWTKFVSGGGHIWFARSTDNGATWSTPLQISTTAENGLVSGSRPVVGPNGEVYVVYNALGSTDADNMKVAKSTNYGVSFSSNVVAGTTMDNYFTGAPGFNRGRAINFPAVAVDRSLGVNRGRLYMTYQSAVNFYGDALGGGTSKTEVENNGNFANATPFTINQTLRGTLSSLSEIDNWKFSATQGTTYVFFVDSVKTTTFKYTMRLYCPNDTLSVSRLCMSSDGSSSSSVNVHALIVWTAPTTNTYYLRMQGSASSGGYRIRSGKHIPVSTDGGRDARDVVVVTSNDGVTWNAPVLVNDDLPYYDNWLPEVAVPSDGYPYILWYDWRDTPASCFGGSNIYLTRSLDAGATWTASQAVTTVTAPNWTQTYSNIAPNQGDYNSVYGGDCLAMAWADPRDKAGSNTLGDPDVYTARLLQTFAAACGDDGIVGGGGAFDFTDQVTNASVMFPCTVDYTLTADRGWAGLPITGSTTVPAGSVGSLPFSVMVPDSAANGVVRLCLTATLPNGALSSSCCLNLTVDRLVSTLASLVNASAASGQVQLQWELGVSVPATLYRSTDGLGWVRLASLTPDGLNRVSYEDGAVTAGQRYGYRLGLVIDGTERTTGETWVDVPLGAVFALKGALPNPASGPLTVSFSLANSLPARLELVDLSGRRVFERQVGELGPGTHVVRLDTNLPAGIYAMRLTQGSRVLTSKATIVR